MCSKGRPLRSGRPKPYSEEEKRRLEEAKEKSMDQLNALADKVQEVDFFSVGTNDLGKFFDSIEPRRRKPHIACGGFAGAPFCQI